MCYFVSLVIVLFTVQLQSSSYYLPRMLESKVFNGVCVFVWATVGVPVPRHFPELQSTPPPKSNYRIVISGISIRILLIPIAYICFT